ncbi:holo-[acyl-carrier-protein] synthase [Neorhodopirellula lusitana]|uniref:Holo-[acyl-carrier-protein] synthase n=1 Tax=Neorhodopirellula lusitana TaxID=445327 RepID=A0ABY1QJE4_9BACT|nr:holo-ACP synthase [Neorhodopirellula lusitana]SMP72363.1 holo-[acyl-carrier-protein] synthase [Neorhodopirellula lusitana]
MAIVAVGTEIVQCVRISQMIQQHGEQFLERVYTPGEIDHCAQLPDATGHFARRWAAKQAVFKALHCSRRGVSWTDIEIQSRPGEGHAISLSGAAERIAEEAGVDTIHLSLGGCRTQAIAYVILWQDPDQESPDSRA